MRNLADNNFFSRLRVKNAFVFSNRNTIYGVTKLTISFPQDEVDKEVATLLSLKVEYKTLTGEEVAGGGGRKDKKDKKANKENKPQDNKQAKKQEKQDAKKPEKDDSGNVKKQTRSVLTLYLVEKHFDTSDKSDIL